MRAVVSAEDFVGSYNGAMEWHFVASPTGERMLALTAALRRAS